ncbi:MAG: hypothetical protein IPK19_08875 [Chloroflexi bacterium]|nr:hypothetical protein [Chloroflexota bacterium]
MGPLSLLRQELQGSVDFFLEYTNLEPHSRGYGLTADSTKEPQMASIAATGFALTAWVIAAERGFLARQQALEITRGSLYTLLCNASHHRGFFAHFQHVNDAQRWGRSEYSTIDTALCLNGVITAAAYFEDEQIHEMAQEILERVDWSFIVFEKGDLSLFHMAYNPDRGGDYVTGQPGFISRWDMAAEQKMMYLQAARHLDPVLARCLYQGFRRDSACFDGYDVIVNPGGNLFAYQFSEAWLDTGKYLDPDGIDWFNNTQQAILAGRSYCIQQSAAFKTYHAKSWGISAGDSPWGYDVSGAPPSLVQIKPNGTVSIYGAVASLPFVPELALEMIEHLYHEHPRTWGKYGFFDSYNLSVDPPWYSSSVYGIDKGCSMTMVENFLSGLVWDTYTNSPTIQDALEILGFCRR